MKPSLIILISILFLTPFNAHAEFKRAEITKVMESCYKKASSCTAKSTTCGGLVGEIKYITEVCAIDMENKRNKGKNWAEKLDWKGSMAKFNEAECATAVKKVMCTKGKYNDGCCPDIDYFGEKTKLENEPDPALANRTNLSDLGSTFKKAAVLSFHKVLTGH